MTRLISLMLTRHKCVCVFPVQSVWLQVGSLYGGGSSSTGGTAFQIHSLPIATLRRQSTQNKHHHVSESTDDCSATEAICCSQAEVKLWGGKKSLEFEKFVVWRHRATCRLACNLAFRLDGPSKYYDSGYDWGNLLATFKRICKEARWLMSQCHHCPQTAKLFSMFPNMHVFWF